MLKKILILLLIWWILLPMIIFSAPNTPKDNVIINNYWYDWEYEPNFRTLIILDTVINENTNEIQQADYRPNRDVEWLRHFKFTELMDLIVFRGFADEPQPRTSVLKLTEEENDDYAYKLQRLIDENIMTRDNLYYLTREDSIILQSQMYPRYIYKEGANNE